MIVYLDTSSLLKLYHEEDGSEAVEGTISKDVERIYLSDIADLEFRSAIWKKVRTREIEEATALTVVSSFQDDYPKFQWILLDKDIMSGAKDLLMKYGKRGLRTLDSIQLASALSLKSQDAVFITFDHLLRSFLQEEELNVL